MNLPADSEWREHGIATTGKLNTCVSRWQERGSFLQDRALRARMFTRLDGIAVGLVAFV